MAADTLDWWRGGIIYQIYPRSFADSRGNGWGDLNGIRAHLDYIASLGIDAVWISPFFKSPMKDFGYDVEDHRAVDPMFGSENDFDALIQEANARDIKIMVDLVLSHVSDVHPWFKDACKSRESEYSDCFVWTDPKPDGSPPNNWLSIFGGSAWTWNPTRRQYYLHNFLESQPDLNFHNPRVRQEVLSIAKFWLDRGVSGFRLDTVNFYYHDTELRSNPPTSARDEALVDPSNPYGYQDHLYDKNRPEVTEFLAELGALMAQYPGSVTLGEVGAAPKRSWRLIDEYTQPERLNLCYTFDLLTDNFTAEHLRSVVERSAEQAPNTWPCWAFSNHDVTRSATRLLRTGMHTDHVAPLTMSILISLRGTPCIYQGEELGLEEVSVPYELLQDPYGIEFWPDYVGRDGCRTPMPWNSEATSAGFTDNAQPWLPIPESHRTRAVDTQQSGVDTSLNQVRRLLSMRGKEPALQWGSIDMIGQSAQVLAYSRVYQGDRIDCYFNLSNEPASIELGADDNAVAFDGGEQGWVALGEARDRLEPWQWIWVKRPA